MERVLFRLAVTALLAALALAAPTAHAAFPGANGKIAFDGIGTVNPDGSGQSSLVPGSSPAWSPDGRKLAFGTGDLFSRIKTVNSDGSGETALPAGSFSDYGPAWSPDGQRIVAAETPGDQEFYVGSDLYVMNADGSGRTSITNDFDPTGVSCTPHNQGSPGERPCPYNDNPAWSPDGQWIVFDHTEWYYDEEGLFWTLGGPYLARVHPDGSQRSFLAPGKSASWSPDGGRLVFDVGPYETPFADFDGLATANSDGSGVTPIWTSSPGDYNPAWSPDGSKIAFHWGGIARQIGTMNVDGSGRTMITPEAAPEEMTPDWQPIQNLGLDPYPRPGGATPLRVPLVPAYAKCTAPNSTHAEPLDEPSCSPPVRESSLLTTSTTGVGSGSARLSTIVGNPSTPADEADFHIIVSASDVVQASDGGDYTGTLILRMLSRVTDKRSGFGGVPATVRDTELSFPFGCTPVSGPAGGSCNLSTTADTVVPGFVLERKRTLVSTLALGIADAGADGTVAGASCPPTCGTGDERPYLEQGLFTP